ncbi:MAG: porin [Paludibacter sp.]|jgi:hypothetical protein|nr:porin [Paludibacter sp.]
MSGIKNTLALLFILLSVIAKATEPVYTPSIEGTIRGKYEYNSSLNGHRFQVRNARFSVRGAVSPIARYKAEIDLSDEGQTRMLDAYVEMLASERLSFVVGQQKVQFSTDNLRSPHQLLFANRSFLGKQLAGLRDVGATLHYNFADDAPLTLIAGLYNGKGLYNQKEWRNTLSYAIRAIYLPTDNWDISLNYNTIQPYDLRMHSFNAGLIYSNERWHLESEFFYKIYENNAFPDTEGYFVMASYDLPTPKSDHLVSISPRLRFDHMSDDNNGLIDELTNSYTTDDVKRSRLTAGLNFNLKKPYINEIRINYEQYYYPQGSSNQDNKLVIEFVTKF